MVPVVGPKMITPVVKATDMMNSEEENFMCVHRKLAEVFKRRSCVAILEGRDKGRQLKVKYQFLIS